MKQVIQSLADGSTKVFDVPSPSVKRGKLLISSNISLISSGTEKMLINFGKSNLLEKAKKQPERLKEVIDKAYLDGLFNTFEAVKSKLDKPIPLGYCNLGTILDIGEGVTGFKKGDRVISNGPHAEEVLVPANLCAKVPDEVKSETAVFTILASIGLQGIRLAKPNLGETFLVSGLGVVGLLTAQILKANGCNVLGIDPDFSKCKKAEEHGISAFNLSTETDPISWCLDKNSGIELDGVILTASTSKSDPVDLAAKVCRQRGRIILVGVTGLDLKRDLFYKKEISFQVSCSYGPGRYDSSYEEDGIDYPYGLVRWTEQRNFEAILNLMANKSITTEKLISHKFSIDKAEEAYEVLTGDNSSLGIIISYGDNKEKNKKSIKIHKEQNGLISKFPEISFIGAGNYANRVLVPAFAKSKANLYAIAATSGLGPVQIAKKYNFRQVTTDIDNLIQDKKCKCIVIATRHDSHASLIVKSIKAGKHVYVEKPLCLNTRELNDIKAVYNPALLLMVGFNRRYSPLSIELKNQLDKLSGPKNFIYTCNAGFISANHWTQDPLVGGGRLIGESCHFVDFLRFLSGSEIDDLQIFEIEDKKKYSDNFSIQIKFRNGSIGTIHYFSNGSKSYQKERLEVSSSGKIFCLENFRKLKAWGIPTFRTIRYFSQNKGHNECVKAFLNNVQTGERKSSIPFEELVEVQSWLNKVLKK